jgi:rSAM/selenodomain-associated transferase 1
MTRTLIVFAKEPIKGAVKTRLRNCFSDADVIRLYKAFVKDTLAVSNDVRSIRKILAFSSQQVPRFLKSVNCGFEMIEQRGATLGDRMHNVFVYAHKSKSKKTVIIGTDSPTLPPRLIEKAFSALRRKDVVIGPSTDGGYYLIGMKEPRRGIFKGVKWSSVSVLKKTLDNAGSLGMTTALLDEWYDVDDSLSLKRLLEDLCDPKNAGNAKHTRQALKKYPCSVR